MSIILISFVLVMKFTNSFLVSCRSISYNTGNNLTIVDQSFALAPRLGLHRMFFCLFVSAIFLH